MQSSSSTVVTSPVPVVERLVMDHDVGIMVYGPLMFVVWRGETTKHAIEQILRIGTDLLKKHPNGAVVGVVEDSAKLPSSEAREHSAKVNDQLFDLGMVAFAGVLPAQGFVAAWVRGVVTGLTLLSRKRYPFRVFQTTREATDWERTLITTDCKLAGAVTAVEEFRKEYAKLRRSGPN
jgi:hypothetical protein